MTTTTRSALECAAGCSHRGTGADWSSVVMKVAASKSELRGGRRVEMLGNGCDNAFGQVETELLSDLGGMLAHRHDVKLVRQHLQQLVQHFFFLSARQSH